MKTELPTKPGPYYWRESDDDAWARVFEVKLSDSMGLCFDTGFYYYQTVKERGGQWLPIPTADELVELQAKAKMVDGLLRLVDDVYEWRQHIPGPEFCELRADIQALGEYVTIIRKAKR